MRELKFRIWIKDEERYYDESDDESYQIIPNGQVVYTSEAYEEDGVFYTDTTNATDNVIIEQYTWLKDKNGKEIYEGDIVNVIGVGIAQVIDSPSGEWMLYYKREPDEIKNGFAYVVPKNKPSGLWKANTTSYIEVIGNIHENADLLEEE